MSEFALRYDIDSLQDILIAHPAAGVSAIPEAERDGVYRRPSEYGDEPYEITMALIEDGRRHLVLAERAAQIRCPVRILHGMADPDVPWRGSLDIVELLGAEDVEVTFVKSGDHRLSEPADIARMLATVEALAECLE